MKPASKGENVTPADVPLTLAIVTLFGRPAPVPVTVFGVPFPSVSPSATRSTALTTCAEASDLVPFPATSNTTGELLPAPAAKFVARAGPGTLVNSAAVPSALTASKPKAFAAFVPAGNGPVKPLARTTTALLAAPAKFAANEPTRVTPSACVTSSDEFTGASELYLASAAPKARSFEVVPTPRTFTSSGEASGLPLTARNSTLPTVAAVTCAFVTASSRNLVAAGAPAPGSPSATSTTLLLSAKLNAWLKTGGVLTDAPDARIDTNTGPEVSWTKNGVAARNPTPASNGDRVLLT